MFYNGNSLLPDLNSASGYCLTNYGACSAVTSQTAVCLTPVSNLCPVSTCLLCIVKCFMSFALPAIKNDQTLPSDCHPTCYCLLSLQQFLTTYYRVSETGGVGTEAAVLSH